MFGRDNLLITFYLRKHSGQHIDSSVGAMVGTATHHQFHGTLQTHTPIAHTEQVSQQAHYQILRNISAWKYTSSHTHIVKPTHPHNSHLWSWEGEGQMFCYWHHPRRGAVLHEDLLLQRVNEARTGGCGSEGKSREGERQVPTHNRRGNLQMMNRTSQLLTTCSSAIGSSSVETVF